MDKKIEKIIGDYNGFFSDLHSRLTSVGIDTKGLPLIQLLFRASTLAEYKRIRDNLKVFSREYVETDFNGRLVSIIILKKPLALENGFSIDMIELTAPRAAHMYPSGLESIGVFLGDRLPAFKKKYQKVLTGVKDHGVYCKPAFITFDNGKTVKFYDVTLKEIILREGWYFEWPDLSQYASINKRATLINAWQHYLKNNENWQDLLKGIEPKQTGCGSVYELPNPINRPKESFAIADMRNITFSEPHYHIEVEIYFVLQGTAKIVINDKIHLVEKDSVVVIPPNASHYAVVEKDFVVALVNTPPFRAEHNMALTKSDKTHGFDRKQFEKLTSGK